MLLNMSSTFSPKLRHTVHLLRHGMEDCPYWCDGRSRAQRFIHTGVTVVTAPRGSSTLWSFSEVQSTLG